MNFFRRKSSCHPDKRTVYVGHKYPQDATIVPEKYPNNMIISSRYTAWNFIVKNLYQQFRRIANFYFLCIAVIQLSIQSPVSPATSLTPLIFVVLVTAIKQGYEDWLRHKSDDVINHVPVIIYSSGNLVAIKSEDIQVGDIVMVKSNEEVPCDLVILASSDPEGLCHITTANLDGETNLKVFECLKYTMHYQTVESFRSLYAVIECEHPTPDLYSFIGRMTVRLTSGEEKVGSLGPVNLLLKGSRLRNTEYVFGCAVYTGHESKMALNLNLTSSKFSTVERSMNKFLLIFLIILLTEATTSTMLMIFYNENKLVGQAWYVPVEARESVSAITQNFLSFAILFNYIIPISLYVTLEMVKFIGGRFFVWDRELYNEVTNEPAQCNTTDLNEELGQVQYLFTDKTGTLTENEMRFRMCSVDGVLYEEKDEKLYFLGLDAVESYSEKLEHFLEVLCLCNTVCVSKTSPRQSRGTTEYPKYHASSPDEKALVEACKRFGVVILDSSGDECIIKTQKRTRTYKKLHTLEFDCIRKRMSIVVQYDDGSIALICKGADTSVFNRVTDGNISEITEQVKNYSLAGLRTLVVAEKSLSAEEYRKFDNDLLEARNELNNREVVVGCVFEAMEQNLYLLGATGVEDRLQEGVADTLESLRTAGIKIWVLTGDSVETAVSVSHSCGHFQPGMQLLYVVEQYSSDVCYYSLKRHQSRIAEEPLNSYGLILNGYSLAFALLDHRDILRAITEKCTAVLCCRMSPLQKAEVVKLVKNSSSAPITAAIGDGANDVSMIQEAHVGLGIMGKEGRQAVSGSDFAFSKFHYLQRVILVHGQYFYVRISTLVLFFFYKNIAFITPQFIYIFFNGYTPQALYNSVFLMLYNIVFASFPIFIFGFTEKHDTEENLIKHPELYRKLSKNSHLTIFQFARWVLHAIWHSLVFFFGVFIMWGDSPMLSENGETLDLWAFGTVMFGVVVITCNFKLALQTRYWTRPFIGGLIVSVFGFMSFTMVYTGFYWSVKTSLLYGVYLTILQCAQVWFLTVILSTIALLPDFLIFFFETNNFHFRQALLNVLTSSYSHKPRHCLRFAFSNRNEQPNITLSQINILGNSTDSIS